MGHICSAIFLFLDRICSSSYRDHLKALIKHREKNKKRIHFFLNSVLQYYRMYLRLEKGKKFPIIIQKSILVGQMLLQFLLRLDEACNIFNEQII